MARTMKALVCHAGGRIELMDRPVPKIQEPTDAIVQVTLSTICTSDLHIMHGAVPRAVPETVLGHEFVGIVTQVGDGVKNLHPGDRVAANCVTYCGDCWFCRRGYVNNCEHGGWELGCRIDGCQAEYVRVPYASTSLNRIPPGVSDRTALLTGDILSSGYFGAQLCEIRPGDTIAVIGAGPVGQCAMMCARLLGAGRVIALEVDPARLQMALDHGAADVGVNPAVQDAVDAILQETSGRGADGVIEAAGGINTFQLAWQIARPNAVVALVAMYEQQQSLPLERMYGKNLIFKTGGVDSAYCDELLKHLAAGHLDPSYLLTHQGPLNEILTGYATFADKSSGCMKWVVTPYER